MIMECSDHYPGSALEVCVPPTGFHSDEYGVKAPIVRNVENLRVQSIIFINRASAYVRSLLAARRLFWTITEQDAMRIARVDGGLGGELVFDWRLEFRKAHPVVHQVGEETS